MRELLAKSPHRGRRLTLLQHTIDVMDAAECIFGAAGMPTRMGLAWLRFFRIAEDRFAEFHLNLLAAAALHDWGKANDGMQKVLEGKGKQVIRHEHLSGLFLSLDQVEEWLNGRRETAIDQDIVLAAVISHHLKVNSENLAQPTTSGVWFQIYTDHHEFQELLGMVGARLGLARSLEFPAEKIWGFKDSHGSLAGGVFDVDVVLQQLKERRLDIFKNQLRRDVARQRLLWAVRAALIAADAAASGVRRQNLDLRMWLRQVFSKQLCDNTFVWSEVIDKRIAELQGQGKWKAWSDFQEDCSRPDRAPARTLLLAPCGSGKTLAAWRWIAARLEERPAARVIFLYPTRATAKEGFRDYVSWAPDADAALMHGTSPYDLEGMFANEPDDPRAKRDYEIDRRLYALGFWTRRVFSATVDQFLAFLQYGYGPMCMLPVLADSVVVIDEVHSFDRSMFSALKAFLQTFDMPVLCMTATLRETQQEELEKECELKVYKDRPGALKAIASVPRYRVRQTSAADAVEIVRQAIGTGKRVLWVVNQIRRAQQAFLNCQRLGLGVPISCYHSRFRLMDRRHRHDDVVRAFRPNSPPALAITTQVCEMSLDMDADVLVTERCPITSLIQRMGRCHREQKPRPGAGDVWVYEPCDRSGNSDTRPYDESALTGIDEFLGRIQGTDRFVSQMELEDALAAAPAPSVRADELISFLRSGPYAMGGEEDFRDIEDFTVSAVLQQDVADFARLQQEQEPSDGLVLPVPRRLGRERDPRLPYYLAAARDDHYDSILGFCDQPIAEMGGLD